MRRASVRRLTLRGMVFGDFPKTGFCWILDEGCARPERTTFRRTIQDWQQGPSRPCVAACQMGGLTVSPYKQAACQPRWLATLGEQTKCVKLSHCNVRCARTGTTRRRRTRRRPPAGLSSPSSAIPAASTRTTKRRSKYKQGIGNLELGAARPQGSFPSRPNRGE